MSGAPGWRIWRPAIWTAMLGVALAVLVNPYLGILVMGGAIGMALRIGRGRRRVAATAGERRPAGGAKRRHKRP